MTCRWDTEAADYLTPDGDPCKVDEYGDPTSHCTARRTCSQHVGWGELTCARCLGRVRRLIRRIVDFAALMLPEALSAGLESEAANLAGPAADAEAWSWRKVAAMQGRAWHQSLVEDDDDWHPETVLTRWAMMLTEDYRMPKPERWTLSSAAAFLDRTLGKVGQDEGQDFPLMVRELRKCLNHLEVVIHNSHAPERGVPCPLCRESETFVRLVREYAHWCLDDDCERIHVADESEDMWVCPRNRMHAWTPMAYRNYLEDRKGA